MSYKSLTIGQFIQIENLPKEMPDFGREINILSIVYGKPADYFEALPFEELKAWAAKISYLKTAAVINKPKRVLWLKGQRYVARLNPKDFSVKIDLAIRHYRDLGTIDNLHNILAWIYYPTFSKHNPDKAAALFKDHLSISEVYGTFFLFSLKYKAWKLITECSQITSAELLTRHLKEITEAMTPSRSITAGTTHSNSLSTTLPV